jgi:hypothetical protein
MEPKKPKTPEFLNLLVNIEVYKNKKNFYYWSDPLPDFPEVVEKILVNFAWRCTKEKNHEMVNHLMKILDKEPIEIIYEVGLKEMIFMGDEKEIDSILNFANFKFNKFNKRDIGNIRLIKLATEMLIKKTNFEEMKGLPYLFSPQPYNKRIITKLTELWLEKKKEEAGKMYQNGTENLPKLIEFLKESVFTTK